MPRYRLPEDIGTEVCSNGDSRDSSGRHFQGRCGDRKDPQNDEPIPGQMNAAYATWSTTRVISSPMFYPLIVINRWEIPVGVLSVVLPFRDCTCSASRLRTFRTPAFPTR